MVAHVQQKLENTLNASHVAIIDNSWQHAGHAGNTSSAVSGTHLAITVVSPQFDGLNRLERHRLVHKALQEEMVDHIHALEVKTFSPTEWEAQPSAAT